MFKRLILALATVAGLLSPAFASGTIPYSLSQQLDQYGKPLAGCHLYLFAAGTTTPQNGYRDSALTLVLPNPLTCDAAGRLPQFFLADGSIKARLTDKNGVIQVAADNIAVIGSSSGGGGGGTIDPTTIYQTGDVKSRYGVGIIAGFVRLNGRTIGSATSGATERANADTQALFEYLWNSPADLPVAPSRGASANADWVANKTIALPDGRGRVLAGLDDMGNVSAGRLNFTFGPINNIKLGTATTPDNLSLTQAMLPAVAPVFTGTAGAVSVVSTIGNFLYNPVNLTVTGTSTNIITAGNAGSVTSTGTFTPAGTISNLGSGVAFSTVQPTLLITNYIKL